MKLSLEEEKTRLAKERASGKPAEGAATNAPASSSVNGVDDMVVDEEDEEAMLARAIAMSMETSKEDKSADK